MRYFEHFSIVSDQHTKIMYLTAMVVDNWLKLALLWLTILYGKADVYLHNPRGSNNRLNEATKQRRNNNRLFDSQNNNHGGYNVGTLFYYAGSILNIEWTNQHSCNSPNNNCEIILQYMCDDLLRDGNTTQIIPYNNSKCTNNNCDINFNYGMHENHLYYHYCRSRKRNGGLFTSDQKLKGKSALFTRQNVKGNRHGLECPEERDYYPYWHPTPWKDIAILTNDVSRCKYYRTESENVKSRSWCYLPKEILDEIIKHHLIVPVNQDECESFRYPLNDHFGTNGTWKQSPSHGLPPPECRETEYTRDNHLGDSIGGSNPSYQWKIPQMNNAKCILRIRYNISTGEFDGWQSGVNSSSNEDLLMQNFLNISEAKQRGYVLKNNPKVKIFPGVDFVLNLAIDTSEYGRVFQDRTYVFQILPQPNDENQNVYNLNVRGKRGNIVQVFPAVEYDFVPNDLELSVNDFLHVQWTGSNTNPKENEGQGKPGTDRSNMVPLKNSSNLLDSTSGDMGLNYPAQSMQNLSALGFSAQDFLQLAFLNQSGGSLTFDDQEPYFNAGLKQITHPGVFNYMCTRNNDFSNRQQKGTITASHAQLSKKTVGWNGGNFTIGLNYISIPEDTLDGLFTISIEKWDYSNIVYNSKFQNYQDKLKENLISDIIVIHPERRLTLPNKTFQIAMNLHSLTSQAMHVYRSTTSSLLLWQRMNAQLGDTVVIEINRGGVYFIKHYKSNSEAVIMGVTTVVMVVFVMVGGILYFYYNQQKWNALLKKLQLHKTPQTTTTTS